MDNIVPRAGGIRRDRNRSDNQILVNKFTFFLYLYFLVDFFLHLSARIPVYATLRPTLLLVLILTALLLFQREKFKGWTKDPVMQAMLVFVGYLVLSLPFVEWQGSVIRNNLSEFVKAIVFLFFTALIVDNENRLKLFLFIFVGAQLFRVLEPLYLHITTGYWGSSTYIGDGEFSNRLSGAPSDVINSNELGFVIVTVIPFLHYLVWPGRAWAKIFYVAVIPAMLYALILTQSRGAFLALLVVAWMIFKSSKHKLMLIVLAFVIAVAGWSVMSSQQKDRYLSLVGMSQVGGGNAGSAAGRISGMMNEFGLAMGRPIVGHGLGTTPEAKTHILGSPQAAHNFYAELLVETGILGFVLFMSFIVKVYRKLNENGKLLVNVARGGELSFYRRLNQAMITVFWMYVVYSTNYWGLSQYYWYLFAGLCIVFSNRLVERLQSSESEHTLSSRTKMRFGPNRARA
jgi:O-antigen ligase